MQPPSGGCVLKHEDYARKVMPYLQPPSGGCVLKQLIHLNLKEHHQQPPSGGCVLKLFRADNAIKARFSRLRAAVC